MKIVKDDGRVAQLTIATPTVIRTVEMIIHFFHAGLISLTALISKKSIAKRVVIKQTRIPMELTSRG